MDYTGAQFWRPHNEGRRKFPQDIIEAVALAWQEAWRHADGTICPECAPREDLKPDRLEDVCAVLAMVRIEGI